MVGPKIIILTSNYGNGHVQVAKSLAQEFLLNGNTNVTIRDLFYETSPMIHEWTKKIYLKSYTKGGRQMYRLWYYSSKEITKRKNLKILSYGFSKLSKMIEQEKPDVIFNTFPSFAVPFHRNRTNEIIPTYNIITDYCLHDSWIHPNIDKYYVASSKLKHELLKKGVDSSSILVSGIPVDRSFEEKLHLPSLYQKYHLHPTKKTVLIVAGAYGVSNEMQEICDGLKDDPNLQLIIVCGKNQELLHQLQIKYRTFTHIHVFGYVTEMAELLNVATCVITKPGGVILSEALATNTPILLPKATPGQERENALFFQESGGAIWNEKVSQLIVDTKNLLNNEARLTKMKNSLAKLHVPQSTRAIVTDVLLEFAQNTNPDKRLNL